MNTHVRDETEKISKGKNESIYSIIFEAQIIGNVQKSNETENICCYATKEQESAIPYKVFKSLHKNISKDKAVKEYNLIVGLFPESVLVYAKILI